MELPRLAWLSPRLRLASGALELLERPPPVIVPAAMTHYLDIYPNALRACTHLFSASIS